MEHIRTIKEKIQSCISCDENHCPMIKDRLDQHVLSRHSSFKRSFSSQQITSHQKYSKIIYASRNTTSGKNKDDQTSTSDLIDDSSSLGKINKPTYKEELRAIILECIKKLPTNQNIANGNIEQNKINEFIEKIIKLTIDYTDVNYDVQLNAAIDDFLYTLPLNIDKKNKIIIGNLKTKIATKISKLNKKIARNLTKPIGRTFLYDQKKLKHIDTTSDLISYFKNNKKDAHVQNSDLNILMNSFSDRNDSISRFNPNNNNNDLKKKSVDTQFPNYSSSTLNRNTKGPDNLNRHMSTYDKRISRDDNTYLKENYIKKIIMDWVFQLNDEVNLDIAYSDIYSVTEELYKRLLPLLNNDTDILRNKVILKEEIINFINEYFTVAITSNSAKVNKCVENLTISLLSETTNYEKSYLQDRNAYFLNCFDENIGTKEEFEKLKPFLHKNITKNLEKYNADHKSKILIEDIIKLISKNLHLIHRNEGIELKVMLFKVIKSAIDLSDVRAAYIAHSIIKTLDNINLADVPNHNSTVINSNTQHCFGNIISVFKSEQELIEASNNLGPPIRKRKSSILKKSKMNSEELVYTNKLTDLMMAWVNTLPNKHRKSKNKKLKELLINKLVEDILDHVKLEQIAPETSEEKDKYMSFFIYRWLNRYEYFEDINEAKPYVDQLVEKIKDIPIPNLSKTQSASQKSIGNINLEKSSSTYKEPLLSNEMNMLKNEISNWINEQQSKIFLKQEIAERNKMIHKFALEIHEMINNCSPNQLNKEIKDWLIKLIRPDNKQNITRLAESLENRIEKFKTIKKNEYKQTQKISEPKQDNTLCCGRILTNSIVSENTLKNLIAKYLEQKYDSENFLARKAYAQLFKNELRKFHTLPELDENMSIDQQQEASSYDKLSKELQYIKIISNWLKNIPLQESFNSAETTVRAELLISFAKKIRQIKDNMQKPFCDNEYIHNISLIISEFTEQLQIPSQFNNNMQEMKNDLVSKIAAVKHMSPLNLHLTTTNVKNQNLTDYIEAYIEENDEEIFENDLKLEACILRLYREIYDITNKNALGYNTCVFNRSDDTSLPCNETIKHFTLEMKYAKEIADWLKSLPLLPLTNKTTQDQLVVLINNLAIKISKTESDRELTDYITNWISELPLHRNEGIVLPVIIQQIMNRVKRINKGNVQEISEIQKDTPKLKDDKYNNICKFPHSCCTKTIISHYNHDPGTIIVETVEEWCKNLPVQAENETMSKSLKENIATKLFQKLGELNMNPEFFNNNIIYEKMLSEEIDIQLKKLPFNPKLQNLKKELLQVIIEQRNEIRKKRSGVTYKHDLEKTIEVSMPYPLPTYRDTSFTFKIYKDRLASMFILENFDHGNDAVKLNYEKRIRKEIDKYFEEIQDKSVPLTKDQIYNELYSALFSVPLPNESSMIEEVEEIKTKCEIDNWFETLPLREAAGVGELLEWDQILAMLAKRLHEFENDDKDCDNKMHKEITKWLVRLPLLPSQEGNIEYFADNLQQRLKSSLSDRRHVPRNIDKSQHYVVDVDKNKFSSSEAAPSNYLQLTSTPTLPSCCQVSSIQTPKKPADMFLEIVKTWCQQLPLPTNTSQEKDNGQVIKDNLIIKILMKISELNINPETFNDDFLYDALLDDELENLLSKLPISYEFIQSKNARKIQLKEAVKAVKPLIKEDKARYDYKLALKNTVDKTLKYSHAHSAERSLLLDNLKEAIVDNFIIYNSHKQNQEKSWEYKSLIHGAVEKYYTLIDASILETHTQRDPLLQSNQLLCELAKIPIPGENAILKETKEIQIKLELNKFFNELSLIEDKEKVVLKNQIKTTLAKQLNNSINSDDIFGNISKIKEDIIKALKKLDENIDSQKVDVFVKRLKYLVTNIPHNNSLPNKNVEQQNISIQNAGEKTISNIRKTKISNEKTEDEQWLSLIPATLKFQDSKYRKCIDPKEFIKTVEDARTPKKRLENFDFSFNQSRLGYESFEKGTLLSSSIRKDDDDIGKTDAHGPYSTSSSNQNISYSPICTNKTTERSLGTNHIRQRFAQTINQPTGPEYSASPLIKSYKTQKSQVMDGEEEKSFNPSAPYIHRNLDQDIINKESNINQSQQPDFLKTIPNRKRSNGYMHNQFLQQHASSTLSQTPNQSQTGLERNHQSLRIPADYYPPNSQDACTQVRGIIHPCASTQLNSNEPSIPFRNPRQPNPITPSTSIPFTPYLSSQKPLHSCVQGQSCRRPSITIFSPTGIQRSDDLEQTPAMGCTTNDPVIEDKLETCECFNKRKSRNVCSVHMRRHCRICNEVNSFCCRMPPYRYPSFYYH